MSEFMPEPSLTLETQADLAAVLATMPEAEIRSCRQRIKSVWLIGLIDEIAASGQYPYNATVNKLACERLGLPTADSNHEGTALSWLVYNAQNFRRSDQLIAAGFTPFTPAMLNEAYTIGAKIETVSNTLTPKEIDGKLYAMLPKKRKRYIPTSGQPAKIVAGKRASKKSPAAA